MTSDLLLSKATAFDFGEFRPLRAPLYVQQRLGRDLVPRWVVACDGFVWEEGIRAFVTEPSSRIDEFIEATRYDFDTATAIAAGLIDRQKKRVAS